MDFKVLAESLNLQEHSGLLTQAQQLWSMLDDMAASDPAKYDAFIKKQMEEKERLQKELQPPHPEIGVQLREGSKISHGLNISSSSRVKEPKPNSNEVPIMLNPPFTHRGPPSFEVYEAIYHPTVLEKARLDSTFKDEVISLALDTVAKKFKLPSFLEIENTQPFVNESLKSKSDTQAPASGGSPATLTAKELLAQLREETRMEQDAPLAPLRPEPTPAPKSAPLIQEISTTPVQASLPKPQYTLLNKDGLITITVHLPEVGSIAEMDLDVSERDFSLPSPGKCSLEVCFPCSVDDTTVSASFNKQFKILEIKVRTKSV